MTPRATDDDDDDDDNEDYRDFALMETQTMRRVTHTMRYFL